MCSCFCSLALFSAIEHVYMEKRYRNKIIIIIIISVCKFVRVCVCLCVMSKLLCRVFVRMHLHVVSLMLCIESVYVHCLVT